MRADQSPRQAAFVTAHEVRHVWQLRTGWMTGLDMFADAIADHDSAPAERDANLFAERITASLTVASLHSTAGVPEWVDPYSFDAISQPSFRTTAWSRPSSVGLTCKRRYPTCL